MPKPESVTDGTTLDLTEIEREMRAEDVYQREGHGARTLIREGDLRVVLIAMKPGSRIAAHQTGATVSIHAIRGHARLQVKERTVELRANSLLVLAGGLEHDVEAIAETALLLTLGGPVHDTK